MSDEKFEREFRTVDLGRRTTLKKVLLGAAFSVPIIASFSLKDVANATTTSSMKFSTETDTVTVTQTFTVTVSTCTPGP
jgi:hypothetical protein